MRVSSGRRIPAKERRVRSRAVVPLHSSLASAVSPASSTVRSRCSQLFPSTVMVAVDGFTYARPSYANCPFDSSVRLGVSSSKSKHDGPRYVRQPAALHSYARLGRNRPETFSCCRRTPVVRPTTSATSPVSRHSPFLIGVPDDEFADWIAEPLEEIPAGDFEVTLPPVSGGGGGWLPDLSWAEFALTCVQRGNTTIANGRRLVSTVGCIGSAVHRAKPESRRSTSRSSRETWALIDPDCPDRTPSIRNSVCGSTGSRKGEQIE